MNHITKSVLLIVLIVVSTVVVSFRSNLLTIKDIYPLNTGDKRIYHSESSSFISGRITTDTVIYHVLSETLFKGKQAFSIRNGDESYTVYYDGNSVYSTGDDNNPHIVLQYPMTSEIYTDYANSDGKYAIRNARKDLIRFVSDRVPVNVPAGTFLCYQYERLGILPNVLNKDQFDTSYYDYFYYAPSVGLVKHESFTRWNEPLKRTQLIELIKYERDN